MLLAAIHAVEFSSCCFFIYDYFPWIFFFSFPSSLCCFAKGSIVIGAEASLSLARRDMQIERICGFFGGRKSGRNHSMAKCVSALCEHWASWVWLVKQCLPSTGSYDSRMKWYSQQFTAWGERANGGEVRKLKKKNLGKEGWVGKIHISHTVWARVDSCRRRRLPTWVKESRKLWRKKMFIVRVQFHFQENRKKGQPVINM